MLLDSPLNKAGLLQVYIHTAKNVLIEVNPQTRIPRTFKRFCGLMGAARSGVPGADAAMRADDGTMAVQLLHKLSIRASDGPQRLLRVIRNPVTDHLPVGCRKIGLSHDSQRALRGPELAAMVPQNEPVVFVVGAMAHGEDNFEYVEEKVAISEYPLSAAAACSRLCCIFEEAWAVL